MNSSIVRTLPAALALALACIGGAAFAQTTTQKAENAGEKAWDATKKDTEKAWDATKQGSEKAWDATKHGTKKAVKATEKGAKATGKAVDNVASDAAAGTRKVGNKIGEKIPGTEQNEAAKKP
ncbi:hypothetical protein [Variovorax ginsengisoli]|uniref:Late embryogenesis abundant protein n=1 Tax=Variovorax ginsengisoli TaxID=363844 RepID=A0ABT8SAR4_9BURK|nr:hypothetical protein [Variovorax ginsengisoli]MDN8616836.1 hypothetical protein [Variovorax ginsengisoli]MDO1536006.1 hypothetical protein [Variovorax ginsengisoli]